MQTAKALPGGRVSDSIAAPTLSELYANRARLEAELAVSFENLLDTVWQCERTADKLRLTWASAVPAKVRQ